MNVTTRLTKLGIDAGYLTKALGNEPSFGQEDVTVPCRVRPFSIMVRTLHSNTCYPFSVTYAFHAETSPRLI